MADLPPKPLDPEAEQAGPGEDAPESLGRSSRPPLFLAFQASADGPHGSPVEIGLADSNGYDEAFLIRRQIMWRSRTWSPNAQERHGIDLQTLSRWGHHPSTVLSVLLGVSAGRKLYSGSVAKDEMLLNLIFESAKFRRPPAFRLGCAAELFRALARRCPISLEHASELATAAVPPRHWASGDAARLAAIYDILKPESAHSDVDPDGPPPFASRH